MTKFIYNWKEGTYHVMSLKTLKEAASKLADTELRELLLDTFHQSADKHSHVCSKLVLCCRPLQEQVRDKGFA